VAQKVDKKRQVPVGHSTALKPEYYDDMEAVAEQYKIINKQHTYNQLTISHKYPSRNHSLGDPE
jgi:hypothetical protein